jgi:hypothetical protein
VIWAASRRQARFDVRWWDWRCTAANSGRSANVAVTTPGTGHLCVVLQLPSAITADVSPSPFETIQQLRGKTLWLGIFHA